MSPMHHCSQNFPNLKCHNSVPGPFLASTHTPSLQGLNHCRGVDDKCTLTTAKFPSPAPELPVCADPTTNSTSSREGLTHTPNFTCPGVNPSSPPAIWPSVFPGSVNGNSTFAAAQVKTPGTALPSVPHMPPHQRILLAVLPSKYVNVRPLLPPQQLPP